MSDREVTPRRAATLPLSLYIHVPFCARRCAYCSFCSAPMPPDEDVSARFVHAVHDVACHWASLGLLDDVTSVYVGGGTPTVLEDALVDVVEDLLSIAVVAPGAGVTVEANPETLTCDLVRRLRRAGVNRFSVGVQSLDEAVLAVLGRQHSAAEAEGAVRHAIDSGASVSVDLMCGAPGQTVASWRATLRRVAELDIAHVSVYPLSLEEGTPLATAVREGRLTGPDEDETAEMMELAEEMLAAAGLQRYEVASYARPGHECEHNVGYWTGRPYLGIGPSAASMLPYTGRLPAAVSHWGGSGNSGSCAPEGVACSLGPGDAARVRFTTAASTEAFLRGPLGPPDELEWLTDSEAAAEDAMLGLRLVRGISDDLVEEAGIRQGLMRLTKAGLVERADGRWRTTHTGWLLGNEVFGVVWESRVRRGMAWHSL